jgi:hypothetical protein
LLWCVPARPHRFAAAVLLVGSVASAATTGALIAMGRRLGSIEYPFAAIGAAVSPQTVSSASSGLVVIGVVVHLAVVFMWSWLCASLVASRRAGTMVAAFIVALAAHVVSWLVAWWTGAGLSSVLALGDRLVLAVVFAVALVVGIRLAFSPSRSA